VCNCCVLLYGTGGALTEHSPFGVQGEDRVNRGSGAGKRTTTNLQDEGKDMPDEC